MCRRVGAVYVVVLMASLLVASLSMAALHSTHYFARDLNDEAEFWQCQMAADAGLEWAIARINSLSNWRASHSNNVDIPPKQLGNTSLRYRLLDTDGNLNDNSNDACDLWLTASAGNIRCCWRASLTAAGPALKCLNYAVACKEDIVFKESAVCSTDQSIASEKKIEVTDSSTLSGDCYSIEGSLGAIYGSINGLSGSLEIPDWNDFSYYLDNGTPIDGGLLPVSSGKRQLKGHLLSQNSNTISGALNPLGVYVIDCKGSSLVISNSRLQCTLVLINVSTDSAIADSVYWEAAQPNFPALLINGRLDLRLSDTPLKESSAGRNLNPLETPYIEQSDSNLSTVYPSQIRGLIYASEEIYVNSSASKVHVFGCVMSKKKWELYGNLTVHYRDVYAIDPPPGFGKFSTVRIEKGTIRRVAAP